MRGSVRSVVSGGALIVVAMIIAGCSAAPGFAPSSSEPRANATTPTPTPTTTAIHGIDPTDPSSWIIDFDGVGPAQLGVQLAVDRASLGQLTDQSQPPCPVGVFATPTSPTIILVPDASESVQTIDVMGLLWSSRTLDFRDTPHTVAGVGVDSTLSELRDAYPGIQRTGQYSFIDYYAVTDGFGRWIVFAVDTDTGDIWGIQVGDQPTMPSELCG
jgi:hypothetical protein